MMESSEKIVFAEPFDVSAVERMRSVGLVTVLRSCDAQSLIEAVADCGVLLVRSYAQVTREVIEGGGRLRVIARGGVGLDNVDVEAARERGIIVVHTPAAATDAVADLTVGLIIALTRKIAECDAMVRAGRFQDGRGVVGARELSEMTLGVVGLGRIGRAVARRMGRGFGSRVLYNDIVDPGRLDFAATGVSKEHLFAESDVVSLHVPLTDKTRHLIDADALLRFKAGASLINTSRGGVVDSDALAEALVAGRVAGAALDVFEPEPVPVDHPLARAPNTLFTPHIGARTIGGLSRMNDVVDDVVRILRGEEPHFPARG